MCLLSLVMIVLNEADTIEETLNSCKKTIDRWTILDTGSTDGTRDIIRRVMKGIPGCLFEEEFIDFSTTRNRVIELEKSSTFSLMLSGGETLENGEYLKVACEKFFNECYKDNAFYIYIQSKADRYKSSRLIKNRTNWSYKGVTHEVLTGPNGEIPSITIEDCLIKHKNDSAEKKKDRWSKDIELLIGCFNKNPFDTRTVFYIAQTYECLGDIQKAIEWYEKRIIMEGWKEEVYESKYRIAKLLPMPFMMFKMMEAYQYFPHRAEPLYKIAYEYFKSRELFSSYIFAKRAVELLYPKHDNLFIDSEVYEWKAQDLLASCAFAVGEVEIGYKAACKAFKSRPGDDRLKKNLEFYHNKMVNI